MFISAHLVIMHSREWCATHITFQSNPFTKQLVYIQVQRSSKRGPVKLGHSSCASPSAQREKNSAVMRMKIVYSQADYLPLPSSSLCWPLYFCVQYTHCHWRWAMQNLEMEMRSLFSQQILWEVRSHLYCGYND